MTEMFDYYHDVGGFTESQIDSAYALSFYLSDGVTIDTNLTNSFDLNLENFNGDTLCQTLMTEILLACQYVDFSNLSRFYQVLSNVELQAENRTCYPVIASVCAVARHSSYYWNNNFDAWMMLFPNSMKAESQSDKERKEKLRRILLADVEGAVKQGIRGFFTGGGIGALAGVMVGAPIYSAVEGVLVAIETGKENNNKTSL